MEFKFDFHDLHEAQFVADLLNAAAKTHVRSGPGDDRPELLREMAGKLRRFINDHTPKDTSDIPF